MRLRPGHFVLALIILVSVCHFIGNWQADTKDKAVEHSYLIKITADNISDSISKGTCLVLFYQPNSRFCRDMEYKLNRLALEKGKAIRFYAVNMENEIKLAENYNISGFPSILLFKNGGEYKRIMGVVPLSNLRMIYERDIE